MSATTARASGERLVDEPMAKHTTWRVGGPADVYYSPRCRADLIDFLRSLDAGTPVTFVGLGSNLLVRDGGVRGVVVATGQALTQVRDLGGGRVEAEAGVPCTVLARQCGRWRLGPAEWFAGIPGTVGGALTMNAGAFGGETWARVLEVDVVNRSGEVTTRPRADFTVGYREVRGPGAAPPAPAAEFFLAARFAFDEDYDGAPGRLKELMAERARRQPLGLPSCGSVFRNPSGDHAARLIEAAGLKGLRVGGAEVSPKHANFIINTGGATAADIETLIGRVRDAVAERHGIVLVPEVHIIGEPARGVAA
jgi:UDP-N-acetylmuramate dehydrogenase